MLSIEKAENAGLPPPAAISVSLPGFQFPADEFFSEKVPRLLAEPAVLPQAQEASQGQGPGTGIRSFFQQGAVQFSVGASERIIEAQISEVVFRVPRSEDQEDPKEREEHDVKEGTSEQGDGDKIPAVVSQEQ
ncbi:unnamed protein product [Prorocentrum cordatum]|uniref:Uncharacterized protein n=1 Tax=Prorocentrum cordatum TaxID=2364126 RepID=A0ABN9R1X7_9DINO|nr:unnamed protein product [Polarella glacialis]